MKILHLVNHCMHGHGNVHVAVDLACVQALNGEDVSFASQGGGYVDLLKKYGVKHIKLVQRTNNPLRLAISMLSLIFLVRKNKYNVLHAHMMAGALFGYISSRFTRSRLVTTVHNSFDSHSTIMKLGDAIVAVSEAERNALRARGFEPSKLSTVMNSTLGGVRATFLSEKLDFKRPQGTVVTTVCGLHGRKGVKFLIEAFAEVAFRYDVTLVVVGDGPDKPALEAQAASLNLGHRIVFMGGMRNPGVVLQHSDIFVLASLAEPLGLVNLEARMWNCAIIASNVGGIPEVLDGGRAGILIEPGNIGSIASALESLLKDRELLLEMRARAGSGLERYSINNLYEDYRDVYQGLQSP